jgi:hypothetical protein
MNRVSENASFARLAGADAHAVSVWTSIMVFLMCGRGRVAAHDNGVGVHAAPTIQAHLTIAT